MRAQSRRVPLREQYRVNESNLALRRDFLLLGETELAALRAVAPWARKAVPRVAAEVARHELAHPALAAHWSDYASFRGLTLDDVRAQLEHELLASLGRIFEEAFAGRPFGLDYFEGRLEEAIAANTKAVALKWCLGSQAVRYEALARSLRRRFPHRPFLRRRAERALRAVLNYDVQAVADAFLFDTLATIGVALDRIDVDRPEHDLSDRSRELKRSIRESLAAVTRVSARLRETSARMATALAEVERAASEIDRAVDDVAQGAERQARAAEGARISSAETSEAADETRSVSLEGVGAAERAGAAMDAVRRCAAAANAAIEELASRAERIGGIVETITGIAAQTNLLALNAAIEAARAGDEGRGFAVVADEVRKLADESQRSAAAITELTGEIEREVGAAVATAEEGARSTEEGAETVQRAGEAFARIGERISDVSDRVVRIRGAIGDVATVAGESAAATQQMAASTHRTTQSLAALTEATQEVAGSASELDELLAQLTA
jgi:methyl-accepting chemotaxis protein